MWSVRSLAAQCSQIISLCAGSDQKVSDEIFALVTYAENPWQRGVDVDLSLLHVEREKVSTLKVFKARACRILCWQRRIIVPGERVLHVLRRDGSLSDTWKIPIKRVLDLAANKDHLFVANVGIVVALGYDGQPRFRFEVYESFGMNAGREEVFVSHTHAVEVHSAVDGTPLRSIRAESFLFLLDVCPANGLLCTVDDSHVDVRTPGGKIVRTPCGNIVCGKQAQSCPVACVGNQLLVARGSEIHFVNLR